MRKDPQPLADASVVERLISRTRQGATIGDLVSFDASNIEIPPEDLKKLLESRGIQDWQPVEIRQKTAMRKALTLIRPKLESGDLKMIVRKVVEDEDELIYAFVGEEVDYVNVDLDYATRNQVIFNKKTGEVNFTKEEVPEVRSMYEYLCTVYTRRELVYMTKKILRAYGGILMKSSGGMWFVPSTVKHIVDELRGLYMDDINGTYGKSWFRAMGIVDDEDSRATMGEALMDEIGTELEEAESALQSILNNESSRASTIMHSVNRFKVAKGKAEMYATLLQINLSDIEKKVDEASKLATEVLMRRQSNKTGADLEEEEESPDEWEDPMDTEEMAHEYF